MRILLVILALFGTAFGLGIQRNISGDGTFRKRFGKKRGQSIRYEYKFMIPQHLVLSFYPNK